MLASLSVATYKYLQTRGRANEFVLKVINEVCWQRQSLSQILFSSMNQLSDETPSLVKYSNDTFIYGIYFWDLSHCLKRDKRKIGNLACLSLVLIDSHVMQRRVTSLAIIIDELISRSFFLHCIQLWFVQSSLSFQNLTTPLLFFWYYL